MRMAVLGNGGGWYLADLRRAAAQAGHEIAAFDYTALGASIDGGTAGKEATVFGRSFAESLHSFQAVILRSLPAGSLEQTIFRLDALARLEAAGTLVINSPKTIETAVDKFLTTARLAAAGLPAPRTIVCQTTAQAMEAFAELGGDVVVKPLFGAEGRGLARVSDPDLAWRAFQMLSQQASVIYLQEFVPHAGRDLRILTLGARLWGMSRRHANDWRTNVSRGATAEPLEITSEIASLARRSAAAVGGEMLGVDLLPARDGRLLVLEVNAVPGWRALGATLGVDVAARLLEHIAERRATPASSQPR